MRRWKLPYGSVLALSEGGFERLIVENQWVVLAEEVEQRIAELEQKNAWVYEVGRPHHPDDERPWAGAYLDARQRIVEQQTEIRRLRRKCHYYINEARDHRWRWTEHANTSKKLLGQNTELANLLSRAVEAIEHTIDLDDGNFTGPERQRVIDQALTTVADIHEALKGGR